MEAEFVNVFIEKQREHLMDFVSRVIMAETKQHFSEKENAELKEKLQAAERFIGELQPMLDNKIDEVTKLNGRVEELGRIIDSDKLTIQAAATTHNEMRQELEKSAGIIYELRMKLEETNESKNTLMALHDQLSKNYEALDTKYNALSKAKKPGVNTP